MSRPQRKSYGELYAENVAKRQQRRAARAARRGGVPTPPPGAPTAPGYPPPADPWGSQGWPAAADAQAPATAGVPPVPRSAEAQLRDEIRRVRATAHRSRTGGERFMDGYATIVQWLGAIGVGVVLLAAVGCVVGAAWLVFR